MEVDGDVRAGKTEDEGGGRKELRWEEAQRSLPVILPVIEGEHERANE